MNIVERNGKMVIDWLVVLGLNATFTAKVISWRSVTHMCFLAFSQFCSFFFSLNCVISDISALLRETTLTILDSTGEPVSMESEMFRLISLSTNGNIRGNTIKNPIFRVYIPQASPFA